MAKQEQPTLERIEDPSTGHVVAEGFVEGGLRHGPWQLWYATGECRGIGNYENGHKCGPWVYYYKNGAKAAEGSYVDGAEDGIWQYWFEDGCLKSEGTYKRGALEGRWLRVETSHRVSVYEVWSGDELVRRLVPVPPGT